MLRKYLKFRHMGGGMDNPTETNYMEFLTSSWSDTFFYEMRRDGKLLCVAVVDFMEAEAAFPAAGPHRMVVSPVVDEVVSTVVTVAVSAAVIVVVSKVVTVAISAVVTGGVMLVTISRSARMQ